MCEPKEHSGQRQSRSSSDASLEQILQPSTKKQLLGNRNKEKSEDEGAEGAQRLRPAPVEVKKAKPQPKRNCDHSIEKKLAEADADIAPLQPEVESHTIQLSHSEKSEDARIEQQHLPKRREAIGPCRLKPSQIHGQPQRCENDKIAPVAASAGIGASCLIQEESDCHRQQRIQRQPSPAKNTEGMCDQRKGHTQQCGHSEPSRSR